MKEEMKARTMFVAIILVFAVVSHGLICPAMGMLENNGAAAGGDTMSHLILRIKWDA